MSNQTQSLLEQARNELNITWEDPEADQRILRHLADGMESLNQIAGGEQDYTAPGLGRQLLMTYCRYARAEALQNFPGDHIRDLKRFRLHAGHARSEVVPDEGEGSVPTD